MVQFGKQEDRRNKVMMAKVYGMHVPMKMEMEQVMGGLGKRGCVHFSRGSQGFDDYLSFAIITGYLVPVPTPTRSEEQLCWTGNADGT